MVANFSSNCEINFITFTVTKIHISINIILLAEIEAHQI